MGLYATILHINENHLICGPWDTSTSISFTRNFGHRVILWDFVKFYFDAIIACLLIVNSESLGVNFVFYMATDFTYAVIIEFSFCFKMWCLFQPLRDWHHIQDRPGSAAADPACGAISDRPERAVELACRVGNGTLAPYRHYISPALYVGLIWGQMMWLPGPDLTYRLHL